MTTYQYSSALEWVLGRPPSQPNGGLEGSGDLERVGYKDDRNRDKARRCGLHDTFWPLCPTYSEEEGSGAQRCVGS